MTKIIFYMHISRVIFLMLMAAFLAVPSIFLLLDEAAALVAFIFIWDMVNHAREIRKRHRQERKGGK